MGITSARITIISVLGTVVIDQLPEFMYNYILSKTNEISFNTHLLIVTYYVHIYSVTL